MNTPTYLDHRIPQAQLQAAEQLAHYAGHAWATLWADGSHYAVGEVFLERGTGATLREIEDATQQAETLCVGEPQYAPFIDDELKNITYESGGHRFRWSVTQDGVATFTVQRPDGDCLEIVLVADKLPVVKQRDTVCTRHYTIAHNLIASIDCPLVADAVLDDVVVSSDDADTICRVKLLAERIKHIDEVIYLIDKINGDTQELWVERETARRTLYDLGGYSRYADLNCSQSRCSSVCRDE